MREIIHMIVVLSLICAASGTLLVNLKKATKSQIEQQVLTYVQGPALLSVLKDRDNDPIKERVKIKGVNVFPAMKDGKLIGVAIESFAPGYSGNIGVMVGFNMQKDALLGIGITTQTETPGIGTRVTKPSFTSRFVGHDLKSMQLKSKGGDVDGISGATYSSTGTVDAVRKAIETFNGIKPEILKIWQTS
ncbi:RnfABCDGE type electron transport complex subunit G [Maridesulfovibrio bastinii]|jgi:electron transport complex protein RnfG|uniref:RnfABCDGE type electron transport complex subunit G n=1 Tax=Maridesulfovibrio bastinii TaxID=47157 RepID=UPI000421DC4C|nr:RnfABCDGE type electron transport complex subunit G [Maridesulfovibrio bastinii]